MEIFATHSGSGRTPTHSHLIGLYPGKPDSPLIDKTIFDAAIKSLDNRGDASTVDDGLKINLWARALDGNRAYKILNLALTLSTGGGVFIRICSTLTHPSRLMETSVLQPV
jgi:hypothetical protein